MNSGYGFIIHHDEMTFIFVGVLSWANGKRRGAELISQPYINSSGVHFLAVSSIGDCPCIFYTNYFLVKATLCSHDWQEVFRRWELEIERRQKEHWRARQYIE